MSDLSLGAFRAALTGREEGDRIQLRGDKQGVATSGWERFKFRVSNFFSRSSTVSRRQQQTAQSFVDAIQREYGRKMGDIARARLGGELNGAQPLTARKVREVLTLLEARGGQNWLKNQMLLGRLTGPDLFRSERGEFPTPLHTAMDEVFAQAGARGLPPRQMDQLRRMYTPTPMNVLDPSSLTPEQRALARAVRENIAPLGEPVVPSHPIPRIDEDRALDTLERVVHGQLVEKVNQLQSEAYSEVHGSFSTAIDGKVRELGLDGLSPGNLQKLKAQAEERFELMLKGSETVLTPEQVGAMRLQVLTTVFDRAREKMVGVEGLGLPGGPARDRVVDLVLGQSGRMDEGYFAGVVNVARDLRVAIQAIRDAPTPEARLTAGLNLGRLLSENTRRMDSDEQVQFMKLVGAVLEARAPEEGAAIRDLLGHPMVRETIEALKPLPLLQVGDLNDRDTMLRTAYAGAALKVFGEFERR